jgi:hypothetical protein
MSEELNGYTYVGVARALQGLFSSTAAEAAAGSFPIH